tara:strand:+ start:820 stop:1332 length:513 start_codon:yes stop_codon:yes gene_type:complete
VISILSIDTDWVTDARTCSELLRTVTPIFRKVPFKNMLFAIWHKEIHRIIDSIPTSELPIKIVNIDHHHDLQYVNEPDNHKFKSSNWLGKYILNRTVSEALWISNYTSEMNGFQHNTTLLKDEVIAITQDIQHAKHYNYDYIFVCQSPHHGNPFSFCAYDALVTFGKNME